MMEENRFSEKSDSYLQKIELTKKEILCLELYLQGMTIKEIGKKIFRSHRTIETHMQNVRAKLEARSRSEVFIKAKKMMLLKEEGGLSVLRKLGFYHGSFI